MDFKYLCTYNKFSASITSCGKLYVFGVKNKKGIKISIPNAELIKEINDIPLIVDKISLNYDKLYAIGRKLENGKYITKLFSLEEENNNFVDEKIPLSLKEINLNRNKENNSTIIPSKIFIGKYRTYVLCINEDIILENINLNNKKL